MARSTFEKTYPNYPFAPLVELGLQIGQFAKERMARTNDRAGTHGAHGLSA